MRRTGRLWRLFSARHRMLPPEWYISHRTPHTPPDHLDHDFLYHQHQLSTTQSTNDNIDHSVPSCPVNSRHSHSAQEPAITPPTSPSPSPTHTPTAVPPQNDTEDPYGGPSPEPALTTLSMHHPQRYHTCCPSRSACTRRRRSLKTRRAMSSV